MKKNTLYLTYNGLLEPLGFSQIIPYIHKLNDTYNITVISFEKKYKKESIKELKNKFSNELIEWYYFNRYGSVLLNLFSICFFFIFVQYIILKNKIHLIHARSFIPGLISFLIKKFNKIRYIYDIRGFWLDEKVDRLDYKKNLIFNFLKKIDKNIYLNSDHIIFLTEESYKIVNKMYFKNTLKNYSVIPTCADKNIFYPKLKERRTYINLGYVGTVTGAYDFDKIINFIAELIKVDFNFKLTIINNNEHNFILKLINYYKIPKRNYELLSLKREEINDTLNKVDIGLFYVKKNYSIKASFPTRIAEFLMCGKPIMSNLFNNDMEKLALNGLIYKNNYSTHNIKNEIFNLKTFVSKYDENFIRQFAIENLSLDFAKINLIKIYNKLL